MTETQRYIDRGSHFEKPRKRLREEEREKGEGRGEERRLGLGLLFETHHTSSFKSVLNLFQLSGSIKVQDGGITLFPQWIALQNMRALQADLLLKKKDVLGLLPAGFGKKSDLLTF